MKKMMLVTTFVALVTLAGVALAQGTKIDPAELSATAKTVFTGYSAQGAVSGSGLDNVNNPTTHTEIYTSTTATWLSENYNSAGNVQADEWFVIDLGGPRYLAQMKVLSAFSDWAQVRNPTRRNLTRFDLYYSNTPNPGNPLDNPGNWTLLLNDQAVPDPESNNVEVGGNSNDLISYLDVGVYDLSGTTASHLALVDMQNGGNDGWDVTMTGIAEIEIFETEPPATPGTLIYGK